MLVDSHAHLDFVEDLDNMLSRAKDAGVGKIITIGTTLEESKRIIELAEKYSDNDLEIWTTAGIHPNDGKADVEKLGVDGAIEKLRSIAKSSKKVIAIGECGLDYYEQETGNNKQKTSDKDKKSQRELFEGQMKLADDLGLPLVIHCRDGWDEIFDVLRSNGQRLKPKGIFHSWTGDWLAAQKALDLGFYISFSGIVTFKNAPEIQAIAKKAPLNRILIETDSPFLAPDPIRGQKNEPKNVMIIASFIAMLRNQPLDEIVSATSQNVSKLFGI